jgi:hypothetical protein
VVAESSRSGRKRVAEFTVYIADFDHMLHYQPTQLDQNKDDCHLRYRQRTDWDGAIIVSKQLCTLAIRHKRGLFDPANESEYRQIRNGIPNIYGKGCKYGSIDILLGVLIYVWDFDRCRFGRLRCSITLVLPISRDAGLLA